eukprot:TRINITY_DN4114_c0_g2_i1.p1 TRINITY_DN4114_c0_g2~~TRINITY_DN4114_c0_g2_i1.p1  ORF type:complete len:566 (+),score=156.23 TRINITY_DN4114_c0_g2_i1:34-1731(+)
MRVPVVAAALALCATAAHGGPAEYRVTAFLDLPFAGAVVAVENGLAVILSVAERQLAVLRVAPVQRAAVLSVLRLQDECLRGAPAADVHDRIVYFPCGDAGVSRLNIRVPESPHWLKRLPLPLGHEAADVSIVHPWAVVADPVSGIFLMNITAPDAAFEDSDDHCFAVGLNLAPTATEDQKLRLEGVSGQGERLVTYYLGVGSREGLLTALMNHTHSDHRTINNETWTLGAGDDGASGAENVVIVTDAPTGGSNSTSPGSPDGRVPYQLRELADCGFDPVTPPILHDPLHDPLHDVRMGRMINWSDLPREPQNGAGVSRLVRVAKTPLGTDALMLSTAMGPGLICADMSAAGGPMLWASDGVKPSARDVTGAVLANGHALVASTDTGIEMFSTNGQGLFELQKQRAPHQWANITSVTALDVDAQGTVFVVQRGAVQFEAYKVSSDGAAQLVGASVPVPKKHGDPLSLRAADGQLVVAYPNGVAVYRTDDRIVISVWFYVAAAICASAVGMALLAKWGNEHLRSNGGGFSPIARWARRDYTDVEGRPRSGARPPTRGDAPVEAFPF